jgi:Swiss Army Knife protein, DSP-PTPase phosphatase domain
MSAPPLPFQRSYWAVPGRLLAGYYPGDLDPALARRKLAALVRCGVELVMNLMEADEVNWLGTPFADYRPMLEGIAGAAGRAIRCEQMPIRDADVPTVAQMRTILDTIDSANDGGQIVYVHCLGGIGRTGTVVGCYLARHGIAVGTAALEHLNALAKGSPYNFGHVPQTRAQCNFVCGWKQHQ